VRGLHHASVRFELQVDAPQASPSSSTWQTHFRAAVRWNRSA
jgi:hypothetical protein